MPQATERIFPLVLVISVYQDLNPFPRIPAHRLHTVMDSDRIMVIEDGMVKVRKQLAQNRGKMMDFSAQEFDHPHLLLGKEGSLLTRLAKNAGDNEFRELARIAEGTFHSTGKRTSECHMSRSEFGNAVEWLDRPK